MRGEFDLLVSPLGGAVVAGDQARPMHPPEVAVGELRRVAGTQLDPDAVEAFVTAYPDPGDLPLAVPAIASPAA